MEYDEGRVDTKLLAENLLAVNSIFSDISQKEFSLLAALYLSEKLSLAGQHRQVYEKLRTTFINLATLKKTNLTRIDFAFQEALQGLERDHGIVLDQKLRIAVASHLIDLHLFNDYQIPPDYPSAVAALIGSMNSTLEFPIVELIPTTAELSVERLKISDNHSNLMFTPASQTLKDLITLKLAINSITAHFIDDISELTSRTSPTFLIDLGQEIYTESSNLLLDTINHILLRSMRARVILCVRASSLRNSTLAKDAELLSQAGFKFDGIILFSSSDIKKSSSDHLLVAFSHRMRLMRKPHLYVDVSLSNKSLEHLDLQERSILAGNIFSIHESRDIENQLTRLPAKVVTILNAQFQNGFQNVSTLCVEHRPTSRKPLKIYSPKSFIRSHQLAGRTSNLSVNPESILTLLNDVAHPACIYIIGNNGAGKTQLLCDLIGKFDAGRKTIGISTGVHDRFPFTHAKQIGKFQYRGARTSHDSISPSRQTSNNTSLASKIFSDQQMLDALKECQECLGFAPRFYFMLKPEMDLSNTPTNIRLIRMSNDATTNNVPSKLSNYEFGVVRPSTEREDERIVSFRSMSSGEQNINQLLLNVITTAERGAVFLIDEPEISLHLKWQQTLPKVFHLLSQRFGCSFVVATHSPTLVANANDPGSHSFMIDLGRVTELNDKERYSVETIILDGFGVYTPHNRSVHETCARIVAKAIETKGKRRPDQKSPLVELQQMLVKVQVEDGAYIPPGHREDIDLIMKAQAAIKLLMDDQEAADKLTIKAKA